MDIEAPVTHVPKHLQFRVALLLAVTLVIAVGFVVYALYARGVFEEVQRVTLVADNAEGVGVRMNLTFAGFPIGTVRRITLNDAGKARIEIDVPHDDAKWLRTSSVFTIERGPVGVGKSWFAHALGHSACRAGHPVRYSKVAKLLLALHQSRADKLLRARTAQLARARSHHPGRFRAQKAHRPAVQRFLRRPRRAGSARRHDHRE